MDEINKRNVTQLEVAFIYRSNTKPANIQANPIVVGKKPFFQLEIILLPAYGSAAPTIYENDKKQYILLPANEGDDTIKGKLSDTFIGFALKNTK